MYILAGCFQRLNDEQLEYLYVFTNCVKYVLSITISVLIFMYSHSVQTQFQISKQQKPDLTSCERLCPEPSKTSQYCQFSEGPNSPNIDQPHYVVHRDTFVRALFFPRANCCCRFYQTVLHKLPVREELNISQCCETQSWSGCCIRGVELCTKS